MCGVCIWRICVVYCVSMWYICLCVCGICIHIGVCGVCMCIYHIVNSMCVCVHMHTRECWGFSSIALHLILWDKVSLSLELVDCLCLSTLGVTGVVPRLSFHGGAGD